MTTDRLKFLNFISCTFWNQLTYLVSIKKKEREWEIFLMINRIIWIPHPHPLPTKRVKLKQSNFMLQENFTNSVKNMYMYL